MKTGVIQRGDAETLENTGGEGDKPFWNLTREVIAAAIEVHEVLGPGLLESIYEAALCHELHLRGVAVQRQVEVPIFYKGVAISQMQRLDLLIEGVIVVELKSVESVLPVHKAQLLSYLRLTRRELGLLLNFNSPKLVQGMHRVVNSHQNTSVSSSSSAPPR